MVPFKKKDWIIYVLIGNSTLKQNTCTLFLESAQLLALPSVCSICFTYYFSVHCHNVSALGICAACNGVDSITTRQLSEDEIPT